MKTGRIDEYQLAREIIRSEKGGIGKERLGAKLGIMPTAAAAHLARYQGETQGHCDDQEYLMLRDIAAEHPDWGPGQLTAALADEKEIDRWRARRWVSRFIGATTPAPELPPGTDWQSMVLPAPQKMTKSEMYAKATELLTVNPELGMQGLAHALGCRTSSARLIREEVRGRLYGHSKDPNYQKVVNILKVGRDQHRRVGLKEITRRAKLSQTKAMVFLARAKGATAKEEAEVSVVPVIAPAHNGNNKDSKEEARAFHEELLRRYEAAGAIKPIVQYQNTGSGILYVITICDVHLGRRTWAAEGGEDYGLEIARQRVVRAVEDLLSKAAWLHPEQILILWGNDLFDVDLLLLDPRHKPLGELRELFLTAKALTIWVIERCRQLAPVHIVCADGNHDPLISYATLDTVATHFRSTSGVTFDNSGKPRKYYRHHGVLLGFAHGDTDLDRLKDDMENQQPVAWGECKHREWLLGHRHRTETQVHIVEREQGRVMFRRSLPALCAADRTRNYGHQRAALGHLYDEAGWIGTFSHPIRANNGRAA